MSVPQNAASIPVRFRPLRRGWVMVWLLVCLLLGWAIVHASPANHTTLENERDRPEANGGIRCNAFDAALRTTDYTYDLRNGLETVKYGGGNQAHRTYTYDKFGNILGVVEPDKGGKADVGYTYDALRRVLTETSGGVTHTYKYDVSGNRTRAIYGGTGRTLDSKYDALNRLSEVAEGGQVTAYAYDLNGNVVEKTLPNADKVTTGYDPLNRAVSIIGRSAPTVAEPEGLLHYGYEQDFDPVGNLIGCVERSI